MYSLYWTTSKGGLYQRAAFFVYVNLRDRAIRVYRIKSGLIGHNVCVKTLIILDIHWFYEGFIL